METKYYDIIKTDIFNNSLIIFNDIDESHRHVLAKLIPDYVYAAILFRRYVNKVWDYCDKFFESCEAGLSYYLGCYIQKRKYLNKDMIAYDIKFFESLLKVYNVEGFKNEAQLILDLIGDLGVLYHAWGEFEIDYPCLFK